MNLTALSRLLDCGSSLWWKAQEASKVNHDRRKLLWVPLHGISRIGLPVWHQAVGGVWVQGELHCLSLVVSSLPLAKIRIFPSSPRAWDHHHCPKCATTPLVSSTSSISQVFGFSWELILSSYPHIIIYCSYSWGVVKQCEFGTEPEQERRGI